MTRHRPSRPSASRRRIVEVFVAFLRLGITSFGGPIAHLGYFRTEFVERRRWLTDSEYAEIVALCQVIPGPASSQVGFTIGLQRARLGGAVAAFVAFTAPSALLMCAFALGLTIFAGPLGSAMLHGLQVVAVIAHALCGMARTLAPDLARAITALLAALCAFFLGGAGGQFLALGIGIGAGFLVHRMAGSPRPPAQPVTTRYLSRAAGIVSLACCAALLVGAPLLAAVTGSGTLQLVAAFSRAGSLVFGGGHVVLPLLQTEVVEPGWLSETAFLSGYGAAQAMPGPLFTFASYLGALSGAGPGGPLGAVVAILAMFLPGLLLLLGVLPFWGSIREHRWVATALDGVGAAVLGLLAAALVRPGIATAITDVPAAILATICFALLTFWKLPPWAVVLVGAAGGVLSTLLFSN